MSRISGEARRDAGKSARQLEEEIDATRAALARTLQELEHRLSPSELLNEALTRVRQHGGEFAHNLGDSVKQHPVPTLLTSIGIAWLMAANGRRPQAHDGGELRRSMTRESARREGRRMGEEAGGRASKALHRGQESARDATRSARRRVRQARLDTRRALADQPLLLGALGLAAGAVLGVALPPPRREDEARRGIETVRGGPAGARAANPRDDMPRTAAVASSGRPDPAAPQRNEDLRADTPARR